MAFLATVPVKTAARATLPNSHMSMQMVKLDKLVSLGSDRSWLYHWAATYVDLMLKGAKLADLPGQLLRGPLAHN